MPDIDNTLNNEKELLKAFERELDNIEQLKSTPDLIKMVAIKALGNAISTENLKHTIKTKLGNAKKSLENIKEESIGNSFKIIYTQMCVLAVSSLEANLKKYFVERLSDSNNINKSSNSLKNTKISLEDILDLGPDLSNEIGRIIFEKANLNFQDLKSIERNFDEYANIKLTINNDEKRTICFYLEIRHVIVHRGGKIDNKFVNNTNKFSSNLKNYKQGDTVELGEKDWLNIKTSFVNFMSDILGIRE